MRFTWDPAKNAANVRRDGTTSKIEPKTDWKRLRSMTDEEIRAAIIDDPDAKPTDEAFWKEHAWSCRDPNKP
jgi:hypothetical protein